MTSFRAAAGSGEHWLNACDSCLVTLGELPSAANLGIVYVDRGLAHALDLIAARLKEATGIEHWVGSGGNGVCVNAGRGEGHGLRDGAMAVMTAALPRDGFRLFDGVLDLDDGALSEGSSNPSSARLAIVHGDPRQTELAAMIERLAAATGAFLVGGLTAAIGNGGMQIAGRPTEGGLSGVLMSPDIPIVTGLTQGCTPIGPVRSITGVDGPWITTLDGRPALDGLKEDVGPVLARGLERMEGFIMAARPEGGEPTDYLVRELGGVDPLRGFVMVGDDLRRGDPLCFVKRDPEGAKSDLKRLTADLKRRAAGREILGALYHSCIGRGRHLFGTDQAELAMIEDAIGPVPLTGFQTNGEIFKDRLYGYSAVLTLFLGEAAP